MPGRNQWTARSHLVSNAQSLVFDLRFLLKRVYPGRVYEKKLHFLPIDLEHVDVLSG